MEILLKSCPALAELEREHLQWLSVFDQQYLRKWEVLRNDSYEAAMCEAAVRRLLQAQGCAVKPNEDLVGNLPTGSEPRPDFHCTRPEGAFFVEVTCISIATVVEQTGLPHPLEFGARNYAPLNSAIFEKALKKYSQYARTILPTLLAVGTFHHSSALCFSRKFADMLLTGETSLSWMVNAETGQGIGDVFQTTELRLAPFLKPGSLSEARTSLSGLLLCGFGCEPPYVLGVLHHLAVRPFDRRLLPKVEFGEVQINHATGELNTFWPNEAKGEAEEVNLEHFLP
jgi:hypothetical protein